MKRFLAVIALSIMALAASAKDYVTPVEADVRENISEWQDLKFGMFIHWGAYSQLGVVESWSLVPEDISWIMKPRRGMPYYDYVRMYEGLKNTFNPQSFDPSKWAAAAKYAGMKYVVFTTKHHDGFCMFDTAQTDYKITSDECPFHTNAKSNVAKEIFDAYRAEGIRTGAYFSIADWHHDDFWWRALPPKSRYINYDAKQRPEKWAAYQDFVAAQLDELTSGTYGDLSLLWFDLCASSPDSSAVHDWDRYARVIRGNQPGTMMVARGAGNVYENYLTPEQEIPDKPLDYPWESCITMTYSWAWRPNLEYKSTAEILGILVKVVSRGGNLLLNVGPRPDGTLEETAYDRLRGIGDWMNVNSEGIYCSKPVAPYQDGKVYFTSRDGAVYAFYVADEGEKMPSEVVMNGLGLTSVKSVRLLGTKRNLRCAVKGDSLTVKVPESIRTAPPCEHIWCFRIEAK